jgi:molecular chaperone DnaJ
VQGETTIKVNIPAGVAEGTYIPLRGEGNMGRRGGPVGDLIVVIEEEPHPLFTRDGTNIILDLLVSFPEAALGADIEVPTLTGRARLKVEAGTQSGTILRMREKGLPQLNGFGKGDQFVRVNVWVPKTLTSHERQLVKQMAGAEHINPGDGDTSANSDKSFSTRVRKASS